LAVAALLKNLLQDDSKGSRPEYCQNGSQEKAFAGSK